MVHLVNLVLRVAGDNQARQGCRGNQGCQASGNQDTQAQREIRGWEVSQVLLGQRETEVQAVHQDY